MGSGLSDHHDAVTAAEHACDHALATLGEGSDPDAVLAFVSSHHAHVMGAIGDVLHRRFHPGVLLAVSGEAVIGGASELEGRPGVSILAARMPGAQVRSFTSDELPLLTDDDPAIGDKCAAALGVGEDLRAVLLFADPFSTPMVKLLPALSTMCTETLGLRRSPIIGGLASAGSSPGANGLIVNTRLSRTGAIGLTISGGVRMETVVSQGCRPFGPSFVVTGCKRNIITTLGGRPALNALREAIDTLPHSDRALLDRGLFMGRVINEYKDRFGRGDFLIRNVVGVDQSRGAIAVADLMRVGQTIQFQLRDAVTADEDLSLLLSAQALREPPHGALLISCNGRGTRLFDKPNHDARIVCDALSRDPGAPPPPLAGFFAGGEIGPIGPEVFLHGHTASLALFRPDGPDSDD